MSALFQLAADETAYRRIGEGAASEPWRGGSLVTVDAEVLTQLASTAFADLAHLLRPSHLAQVRAILDDPEASRNDRFVALELLQNANIAAGRVLPMCQDTGTAIVHGYKGDRVWTGVDDAPYLTRGIVQAYATGNLRYSQMAPLTMFDEVATGDNLPAEIEIESEPGDAYRFLFIAKGGGSANKSFLFQETKALLNPAAMNRFLREKLMALGTAACPPYHLAIVVGGTSAELTMKTLKLATCRALDGLPRTGDTTGRAFRDVELEHEVLALTRELGLGAQFGGKYFCHDVRVIRLPRHGGSLPVGIGVSCSADRQALAKIDAAGVWLEALETDPARFLPDVDEGALAGDSVALDLDRPMSEVRAALARVPVGTRLSLRGTMIVARDIVHARWRELLERGEPLPAYAREHAIYYAGPAKTPAGMPSGSFGPTTAGRMDSYADVLMSHGAGLVTLAKGNRSPAFRAACRTYGGFYLGTIGGAAARLALDAIRKVEMLDYPELGMEAVWKIEVADFPAFVVVDDKGADFYADVAARAAAAHDANATSISLL
ncbi:MAG: fumarate hydratase [Candidatus Eremiobacteraeota bacterium]|nr:fumarate hydratase [Candidatus Eremiobacteraeota bacterium]